MKPICPDCKSQNILYKKSTNTYWCRRCGKNFGSKKNNGVNHFAYLAGLFDGEGSIGVQWDTTNKKPYPKIRARLSMCDLKTIKFIKKITGLGIITNKKRQEKWQPAYEWAIIGGQTEKFLKQILPFSITKQRHIQIALKFRELDNKISRIRNSKGKYIPLKKKYWQEKKRLVKQLYALNAHRTSVAYKYIDTL